MRIAVLIEELAKKTDAGIQERRKRDQAILWNNTFAHCHRDDLGPTIGTDREITPHFLRPALEAEIPKPLSNVLGSLPEVVPSVTFGKDDDEKKKAVAKHWEEFAGHAEVTVAQRDANNANEGSVEGGDGDVTESEIRALYLGANFIPSAEEPKLKKEEER